jgi:hypothetical protein
MEQEAMKNVGDIVRAIAWKHVLLPGQPILRVHGSIVAATPCHDALCVYLGDLKTNPPIYLLEVRLRELQEACTPVLWEIEFRYEQQNFAGVHEEVELLTSSGTTRIGIQTVS